MAMTGDRQVAGAKPSCTAAGGPLETLGEVLSVTEAKCRLYGQTHSETANGWHERNQAREFGMPRKGVGRFWTSAGVEVDGNNRS